MRKKRERKRERESKLQKRKEKKRKMWKDAKNGCRPWRKIRLVISNMVIRRPGTGFPEEFQERECCCSYDGATNGHAARLLFGSQVRK